LFKRGGLKHKTEKKYLLIPKIIAAAPPGHHFYKPKLSPFGAGLTEFLTHAVLFSPLAIT